MSRHTFSYYKTDDNYCNSAIKDFINVTHISPTLSYFKETSAYFPHLIFSLPVITVQHFHTQKNKTNKQDTFRKANSADNFNLRYLYLELNFT